MCATIRPSGRSDKGFGASEDEAVDALQRDAADPTRKKEAQAIVPDPR